MSLEEITLAARRLNAAAGLLLCVAAIAALWVGLSSFLVALAYRPTAGYWIPGLAGLLLVGLGIWLLARGVGLVSKGRARENGRGFY